MLNKRFLPWWGKCINRRDLLVNGLFSIQSEGLVWNHPLGVWNPSQSDGMASRVSVYFFFGLITCITPWWFHTRLCLDSIPQTSCGFHTRLRRDFTSCIFILWSHNGATILHPNTKSPWISRAFRVFRGKKQPPFTVAPFPRPFGLEPVTSTAGWKN